MRYTVYQRNKTLQLSTNFGDKNVTFSMHTTTATNGALAQGTLCRAVGVRSSWGCSQIASFNGQRTPEIPEVCM